MKKQSSYLHSGIPTAECMSAWAAFTVPGNTDAAAATTMGLTVPWEKYLFLPCLVHAPVNVADSFLPRKPSPALLNVRDYGSYHHYDPCCSLILSTRAGTVKVPGG